VDQETRERFQAAVERKKQESRERSHQQQSTGVPAGAETDDIEGDQHSVISDARKSQDVFSVRDKNSGKGKKTADKWNQ
jgi:hypothetical protein